VPTLDKVTVDLTVVLGTTTMPVHQVMRLSRGAIIELDATEADEVKVLANNLPIASGVVLVDRSRIAVEVKQMLPLCSESVEMTEPDTTVSPGAWRCTLTPVK